MELIFALGAIYVGGPLGLVFVLIGGIAVFRRKTPGKHGWPGLLLILGIIMLIVAAWFLIAIANTNFGL